MGNVRTEMIKRTAKELMRRFPDKCKDNFEDNKQLVRTLILNATTKVRNQIAGYITRTCGGAMTEEAEEAENLEQPVGEAAEPTEAEGNQPE